MTPYEHKLADREDGLAYCPVCGGGEGALPTLCPGRRLTSHELDTIYAGRIDFDRGPMTHTPVWWSTDGPLPLPRS